MDWTMDIIGSGTHPLGYSGVSRVGAAGEMRVDESGYGELRR